MRLKKQKQADRKKPRHACLKQSKTSGAI